MATQEFFVGSYTEPLPGVDAKGRGIYRCGIDLSSGRMRELACTTGVTNPSYLAIDHERGRLFVVEECSLPGSPAVAAFAVAAGGELEPLGSRPVPGSLPCHLSLTPDGGWVVVATYGTGSVALYPVGLDGRLEVLADVVYHHGRSVDPNRQAGPHAHAAVVGPDGDTIFVPDLGLDDILRYSLDGPEGKLVPHGGVQLPAGSGPRHLVFHPSERYAFVINELSSTLTTMRYDGALWPLGSVSTLPAGWLGESTAAAVRIAPSGGSVYASNRGHDSLAVFAFDAGSATLAGVQHVPTGGRTPRDFALEPSGRLLIAANQDSDRLTSFWVDERSGMLEATGHDLHIGTPTCVSMWQGGG